MKNTLGIINSLKAIKLSLIAALFFTAGCTIVTKRDYIHEETASQRNMLHWSSREIKLDKPVVLIPEFRGLVPGYGGQAYLVMLAKKPTKMHIKTATLTGPNGSPQEIQELNKDFRIAIVKQRQTTLSERLSNGGFFKGQRVIDTKNFYTRIPLFGITSKFKEMSPLRLEIEASIDDGPLKIYSFDLHYRELTHPDFLRV